jgi:hypothetical protein
MGLEEWFSNSGPQEVARCAANIMEVYFKNDKKPICIEMFFHSLKYINTFWILYWKFLCFAVRREPKNLSTTGIECYRYANP